MQDPIAKKNGMDKLHIFHCTFRKTMLYLYMETIAMEGGFFAVYGRA